LRKIAARWSYQPLLTPAKLHYPLSVSLTADPPAGCDPNLYTWSFQSWDFGDGNQSSDAAYLTHTYNTPGTYTATATFIGNPCDGCYIQTLQATGSLTVEATIAALSLTPSRAAMLVGDNRTLAFADQNGNTVTGASWSIDNGTIASLSTDDPPVITALTPGTATVTASISGLSARATINVIAPGPNGGFPDGTPLWSLAPLPGSNPVRMQRAVATVIGTPSFIGLENDNHGHVLIRGMRDDGQQLWQNAAPSDTWNKAVSTSTGNVAVLSNEPALSLYSGITGQKLWTYTFAQYTPPLVQNFASRSDGVIFMVDLTPSNPRLIGLSEATGAIVVEYALPQSIVNIPRSNTTEIGYVYAGPIVVASDGSVYVEFFSYNQTCTDFQCAFFNATYNLNLARVDLSGVGSLQSISTDSWQVNGNIYTGILASPREVIPDGQGGILAAWDMLDFTNQVTSAKISHGASGAVALPFGSWCSNCNEPDFGRTLILGDNNIAFGLTSNNGSTSYGGAQQTLISFNASTGATNWTWQTPAKQHADFVVSLAGGGVAIRLTDDQASGTDQVLRFDSSGNPTTDTWPSAVGGVMNVDYSVAGDSWLGNAPSSGFNTLYASAQPLLWAASLWQQPNGAGGNAAAHNMAVNSFSNTGANEDAITTVLHSLQAALPLYPACNNWLQGTGDHQGINALQQIQAVLMPTPPNFGHGVFRVDGAASLDAAFSGSANADHTAIPGIPAFTEFVVNDNSAFFRQNDGQGHDITIGPNHYPGNSQRARQSIMVHELAHQIEVHNFQHDFGSQDAEDANNALVNTFCRGLIEGPTIDHLTPDHGPVGTVVTIVGGSFGTPLQGTTVAGTVTFHNVQATVTSWNDIQIVVTVPPGATSGDVVVNVLDKTSKMHFNVQ
jgi:hypothetical protein